MPRDEDRAQTVIKLITAAADAIRVVSGTDGAAAQRLATLAAEEVDAFVKRRNDRATKARAARRARNNSF